ncbi:signal transduction histidine kinase [Aquabacterium commune]|uniref:histidine kinase n=1 Tax=Aquabacterium commune TaxID=70586 RepID=A0A4R6RRN8_9BURK|nr:ATP-binding protein [Aquabacterium commune]TDP88596.1 signal transduction histidine kinase [Aquabacterium commune]
MTLWPRALMPSTLLGRVLLVVCGGLALAHALTLLILLRERGEQGLAMMQAYVGRDVAASVAVLDHLPAPERAAWLPRLARANYRYQLLDDTGSGASTRPANTPVRHPLAEPVRQAVAAELGPQRVGPISEAAGTSPAQLTLPLKLRDGHTLLLQLTPPRPMVSATTVGLLLAQMLALIAAAWGVVRVAVRPLQHLAHTAEDIQPDGPERVNTAGPPRTLPTLPTEVAQATRALQALQTRVQAHVQERTQLLAAISHDLQTPLTRMRLRTEQVADAELRTRLLADLDGMSALVAEGLAYARSTHAHQEAPCAVDLPALLDALVCDAQDAGHDVRLHTDAPDLPPLHTRVQALRRVVGNLLDNALKYGESRPVTVTLSTGPGTAQRIHITVDDAGPGIPEADLLAVLQPFHRVDASRNRDHRHSGGTGLGLAIAQQLSLALGGELTLANRPEGGLRARLALGQAQSLGQQDSR